jgi:glycosyltransferase involved in cell wall biosynthesis
MPLFSLVVSTKGRAEELRPLLESLKDQTFKDFDVYIVSQNEPGGPLDAVLAEDWGLALTTMSRPADIGLSRGRNVGWREATAEFVLFPDDDCWYGPDFLDFAARRLKETRADVLTGRAADEQGNSINGRFERNAQVVTRQYVWTTQIEWVAFFRRSLLERLDGFDVDVGVGATTPWQSCEGQDLILRALSDGARCFYDPALYGHHAVMDTRDPNEATIRKGRAYGRGMGYVLRKHGWGWLTRSYWISRPLAGACLSLTRVNFQAAKYYQQVALGRFEGASGRMLEEAL